MSLSDKGVELLKKHGFDHTIHLFDDIDDNIKRTEPYSPDHFILEAKRIILTEQYDKITNLELSQIIDMEQDHNQHRAWETNAAHKKVVNDVKGDDEIAVINNASTENTNLKLTRKYFCTWKIYMYSSCNIGNTDLIENKLNVLVAALEQQKCKTLNAEYDSKQEIRDNAAKDRLSNSAVFVNRYNAQKNIIQLQKNKLVEQQRIIEDLKFNKIKQDVDKSVEQSKYEIHTIFKNSSNKLKCKIGKIIDCSYENSPEVQFNLKPNKVPSVIKKMKQRAIERELNRQVINDRKRLIDEKKKQLAAEAVENKRQLDEAETKRNLAAFKERRRLELEKDKQRQKNKEDYLASCNIADIFYEKKITKELFHHWLRLMSMQECNELKAEVFYNRKLQCICFQALFRNAEEIITEKIKRSDCVFQCKLKRRCMRHFQMMLREKRGNFQVAEDLYDLRLEQRIFSKWHRNVCTLQMVVLKLTKRAEMHYLKKIKFHYFHQWCCLSAVLLLEKSKEEKKRKWRLKVLEVLPDYKPPLDD